MSRKRSTIMLAFGGYCNSLVLIAQGLILIPLYIHFIGAHLYGFWIASGGLLGMMGVLNFGIGNLFTQRIANALGRGSLLDVGNYFINGLIIYVGIFFLFILIGLFMSISLTNLLKVDQENIKLLRECFQLAVVASGFAILNECARCFSQALLKPAFLIFAIALTRIVSVVIIAILLFHKVGLWSIPIGMIISEGLIFLIGFLQVIYFFKQLKIPFVVDKFIVLEYLKNGSTIFLATIGSAFSRESDPLIITYFLKPELTSAYMICRRGADIVFQIVSVISGSVHAGFSHLTGEGDAKKTLEVSITLLVVIFFISLVGYFTYISMNQYFIELWVGKDLLLNNDISFVVGIAFLLTGFRNLVWQILNGLGDFLYSSSIIFFEGIIKILLAIFLLRSIGIVGIPIAIFISCSVAVILLFSELMSRITISFNKNEIYKNLVMVFVMFGCAMYISQNFLIKSWGMLIFSSLITLMIGMLICVLFNRVFLLKLIGKSKS